MPTSPLLLLHICAGTVGLLSGTVAVVVRKGGRVHRVSGIVFSVAMLTLAASGVWLAILRSQPSNILGGVLTFYMIATAWAAGRRRDWHVGAVDWIGLIAATAIAVCSLGYGFEVVRGTSGAKDGVPAGMDFFLGSVVLLAAVGDLRLLIRGSISHGQRIARHLWRMCFGLFIASGSFFMGRQRIFPAFIRESGVLILFTVLPLLLLIFWMIRVRFPKGYRLAATNGQ